MKSALHSPDSHCPNPDSPCCASMVHNMRQKLKEYLQKSKLQSLIIGESGGIDSALCSALARPVCDELGVGLLGRSITIETNKPDEISRGAAIGTHFCTDFKAIDLTSIFPHVKYSCEYDLPDDDLLSKLRQGNMKARMRMIYLYDLAQKHHGMVLSTDNYTEYLLGFWTLHGDVGDYGMIQSLWKMEVYALAHYLVAEELSNEAEKRQALQSCIEAVPTDGLGITSSDLEQLGSHSYAEVDSLLKSCLSGRVEDPNHPVVKRYYASMYKRTNPLNLSRDEVFQGM